MTAQPSPSTEQPYGIARVARLGAATLHLPCSAHPPYPARNGAAGRTPRVLRVMREAEFLAPARQPEPVVERPHEGTIVTDRPNVMWGTDATAAVTFLEGPATIFAAIDRHGDLRGS